MTLLGKNLEVLRQLSPCRKLSELSVLRIGIQVVQALHDLHSVGFIHRDVKPSNLACGYAHRNVIYLFDFGLARYIYKGEGNKELREPRLNVGSGLCWLSKLTNFGKLKIAFRGTVRYCSINAAKDAELGRHDDLWNLLVWS